MKGKSGEGIGDRIGENAILWTWIFFSIMKNWREDEYKSIKRESVFKREIEEFEGLRDCICVRIVMMRNSELMGKQVASFWRKCDSLVLAV